MNLPQRIHRLEQRLTSEEDPMVRRRMERRLHMLRLPPKERIPILEQRLSKRPENQHLKLRLERLKARVNNKVSNDERIRIIESMLARPDVPHRDRLVARLTLLPSNGRSPNDRSERMKRLQARLVLRPDQPGLQDRLERLQRGDRDAKWQMHMDRLKLKRRPLLVRMKALEEALAKMENAEERVELETKLESIRNTLESRKQHEHARRKKRNKAEGVRHAKLTQRVKTLQESLNTMENAEERMAMETELDRVRNKLWQLEATNGTEKTIVDQDMTG